MMLTGANISHISIEVTCSWPFTYKILTKANVFAKLGWESQEKPIYIYDVQLFAINTSSPTQQHTPRAIPPLLHTLGLLLYVLLFKYRDFAVTNETYSPVAVILSQIPLPLLDTIFTGVFMSFQIELPFGYS